ncbi:MAG: dual specificity protein phosphatase family protein [Verrucomicrobiota bacterium]|jgi:predicted protein tyrosine phosphatase
MRIASLNQEMMVASKHEVIDLGSSQLLRWNILSIGKGLDEKSLPAPGPRKVLSLHFDDVEEDHPQAGLFAARLEDIQKAINFSREVGDQPLLIHCFAGISRSTALAWLIIYDKLKHKPGAVRQAFEIVRKLRPVLQPNRHVLKLGVEALAAKGRRGRVLQQFQECLAELYQGQPVQQPELTGPPAARSR